MNTADIKEVYNPIDRRVRLVSHINFDDISPEKIAFVVQSKQSRLQIKIQQR